MTVEYKRMQQLRGTSAQWVADNIVPLDGELAVERGDGGSVKLKLGDGLKSYAALPYLLPSPPTAPLGSINAVTTAPPAGASPGDYWVNSGTGTVAAGWGAPAAGKSTVPGDHLIYTVDDSWDLIPLGGDLSGYVQATVLAGPGGAAMVGTSDGGTVETGKANTTMDNVDIYQDMTLTTIGSHLPTPGWYGNLAEGIDVGQGYSFVSRSHLNSRINGTVTDHLGAPTGAGKVIAMDGISVRIGGTSLDAVAEARSDVAVFDTASPGTTNPNATTYNARMFVRADGAASGGNMSFFAFAGYTGGDLTANHCNLVGMELDVGRTGSSATSVSRNGISLVSIGNTFGEVDNCFDTAINIATGPQYNGAGQTNAGWGVGIAFSDIGSAAGLDHPIAPNGYLMKAKGTWGVKTIFDFTGITPSDCILRTPTVAWTPAALILGAASQGIELGSQSAPGTSYIDFHTNGTVHDYGARISATGGNATDGTSALTIAAGNIRLPGVVGFGVAPVARPTVPGAAADAGTTMALVNALRTALVGNGLVQ